jgi:multiple sugar transport system ATP-binding protein
MARVALEHLSKSFFGPKGEPIRAVADLSLTVEDRELLVLVGPSGCGKTTTLRLVAGLEEPDAGAIALDGQAVDHLPPKERDVAMVFQNHALFPHLSAFENIALGLRLRRCPQAEITRRVEEAAKMLELGDCLERRPHELSGGQRQRVALGRALVRRPKVFLLDEPLSNLDGPRRVQLRTELARLHRRLAATMIYVTHDQVEAMILGQRIAVMKEGVLQQVAPPLDLYQRPANLFVAGFIGSPPMNFFQGTVVSNAGALCFREDPAGDGVRAEPFALRLEAEAAALLGNHTKVLLGLRPENIAEQPGANERPPGQTVEAVVELLEPAGPDAFLHLATASHSFVARVSANCPVSVNQRVSVVFDLRHAHFFDPETGQALRGGA